MLCVALGASLSFNTAGNSSERLQQWRESALETRALAENDIPRAYEAAQQLEATLPADASVVDRVRVLNLLARIETYLALTQLAAEHAQRAFDLARQQGDLVGQMEADLSVALNSVNQGRIDEVIAAVTRTTPLIEQIDLPGLRAEAHFQAVLAYRRVEQVDDSITTALRAMEQARRSSDPLALTYAHYGLGISYDHSDRKPEAREHFQQMRNQARAAGSKRLQADAIRWLGDATRSVDSRAAERLIRDALELHRQIGAPFSQATTLVSLADLLQSQHRHREAQPVLDEAVSTYERHANPIGLWYALNARSRSHQALGNLRAAIVDAERARSLTGDIGIALYQSGSAQRLAVLRAASGDHRRAYELATVAMRDMEKDARERTSARMIELARRYELDSKQREIGRLIARNEQQATELQQRVLQQRWLWTVLSASAIVLAVTGFFLARLRRSHRLLQTAHSQLQQSRNDLQHLNASLDQQISERTAQLQSTNEELEAFSYSVSHDLRAPLRVIDGYSHMLIEEYSGKLDSQGDRYVRNICASTRRMGQIIDDLLMLARVGHTEILRSSVDLTDLAQAIAADFTRTAPERHVEFVIAPGLVVEADVRLMRVVLENLLGNAWKFTGGRSAARIEVGAAQTSSGRAIFVRDNGAGFEPERAASIFEPFVRLHSTTQFPGTGIGLATVQRVIRRHGGSIWAQAAPGQGATIYFSLPE